MCVVLTSSVNAADVITLDNPKFGDDHSINFHRINRTSRGGDLILDVPDPNWKPTFLHRYEWEYLSEDQKQLLKAFVERHIAIPVFVTGIYGETWKVIFLKPDTEFSQVGRENRSVSLDMQIVQ